MRGFRRLWLARVVSDAGDWLLMIALPVHVFALTGSTLATSAVFLAELLPALLLGSVAGVLVDRWDRRRTLVAVTCAQAVLLLPLLALDRPGRLWIAVLVAVGQSFLARLAGPAGFALLPTLVAAADLPRTNALLGLANALARLGGAPLGGLLYAAGGLPMVVGIDAVTFAAAAALAAAIRVPAAHRRQASEPAARPGLRASWVEGLQVVRGSRPVGTILAATALAQLAQGLFLVLIVVFVERSLHGGGTQIGLLRGVQAVGAVAGGVLLGALARRLRPTALFGYSLVALGVLSAVQWNLPAATTWITWYAVLFALSGLPAVALSAAVLTITQAEVPGSHLGRVAGLLDSTSAACNGLGVLLAGVLGGVLPPTGLLDAQAALMLAGGVLSLTLLGTAIHPDQPAPVRRL